VPGRAIAIDAEDEDEDRTRYEVDVLRTSGAVTEVRLDSGFRVLGTRDTDDDD
jgi:hypothetical protein